MGSKPGFGLPATVPGSPVRAKCPSKTAERPHSEAIKNAVPRRGGKSAKRSRSGLQSRNGRAAFSFVRPARHWRLRRARQSHEVARNSARDSPATREDASWRWSSPAWPQVPPELLIIRCNTFSRNDVAQRGTSPNGVLARLCLRKQSSQMVKTLAGRVQSAKSMLRRVPGRARGLRLSLPNNSRLAGGSGTAEPD
jgi:hypothetical protein